MKYIKGPKELNVPSLYLNEAGVYYYKFRIHGKAGCIKKLDGRTPAICRQEADRKQQAHDAARNELIDPRSGAVYVDPFATGVVERVDSPTTVSAIGAAWRAAGWPEFGSLRPLPFEKRNIYEEVMAKAVEFFADYEAEDLTQKDLDDFFAWRTKGAKPGQLLRSVDMALNKLSAMLTWAARRAIIRHNPIRSKIRYQQGADVHHCTEFMPRSDEELHKLAAFFFNGSLTSEVLGWQLLFEAYTGCRTSEILKLRMDANEGEAGFVNWALGNIYVNRAKGGRFPYVVLEQAEGHSPLVDLIKAHRTWHRANFNGSPWYFPSRYDRNGDGHVSKGALSKALKRATASLGVARRTSHGLRAFYVRTCRSLGLDDTEISIRLGHRSGVALIEQTYGEAEPNWRGKGLQDWMPEGRPAYGASPPTSPLSNRRTG